MPADDVMFPLAHVFSKLVYSQPVEGDGEDMEMADFVHVHAPAPLGRDRNRFLSLLREMCSQGSDYAEQFKDLTVSGVGVKKPETKMSIISILRNRKGMDDQKAEELDMLLWQSRLVLSLGEFFDKEQQELVRELAIINEREKGLLAELRKDSNDHFDLTSSINEVTGSVYGLDRLRVKAWSRLFFLGSNPPDPVDCFVTTDRDAIEMMIEVYEKLRGNKIEPFITLSLPAFASASSTQLDKIKQLRQANLAEILSWIFSGSTGRESMMEYDCKIVKEDWAKIFEVAYPLADTERLNLHVHKFPDMDPQNLFLESFGGQVRIEKESQGAGAGTIICWLESDKH